MDKLFPLITITIFLITSLVFLILDAFTFFEFTIIVLLCVIAQNGIDTKKNPVRKKTTNK